CSPKTGMLSINCISLVPFWPAAGCSRRRPGWVVSSALLAFDTNSKSPGCRPGSVSRGRRGLCLRLLLRGNLCLSNGVIWVADLEAGEAADADVFAELGDLLRDELLDGQRLLLDEGLLEQADLLVELGHLALEHLLDDVRRLAGGSGLRAIDVLLALDV